MTAIRTETRDGGRLVLNAAFAPLLEARGLTTAAAVLSLPPAEVVRDVDRRVTARVELSGEDGTPRAFYLKRHGRPPAKEYVKPLLRLTRPLLGARPEWEALLAFHAAGLPTMVPVAYGTRGAESFVMTEALDDCDRADLWAEDRRGDHSETARRDRSALTAAVARLARTMHAAGMHHQDFYLCHMLLPRGRDISSLKLIDLGRVRKHSTLPDRWRVKDLAQLLHSAGPIPVRDRVRFLRAYLGRPIRREDRPLLDRVTRKAAAIGRHTAKNAL